MKLQNHILSKTSAKTKPNRNNHNANYSCLFTIQSCGLLNCLTFYQYCVVKGKANIKIHTNILTGVSNSMPHWHSLNGWYKLIIARPLLPLLSQAHAVGSQCQPLMSGDTCNCNDNENVIHVSCEQDTAGRRSETQHMTLEICPVFRPDASPAGILHTANRSIYTWANLNLLSGTQQQLSDLGSHWIGLRSFTSPPTQYRLYGRQFLQVKRPNQQYQTTEGTYNTQITEKHNNRTHITKNTANPLVYTNMGWLGMAPTEGRFAMPSR